MSKDATPPEPFHDATIMPFGKYKGKALINVPAMYLIWLYGQGLDNVQLKAYIIANLDALQKEADKATPYRKW